MVTVLQLINAGLHEHIWKSPYDFFILPIQRWERGIIYQALIPTFMFPNLKFFNEGANLWRENSNSKANFGSAEAFFSIWGMNAPQVLNEEY